jgi:predicted DsbA family dithiol-disulfide isomerase
LQYARRHGKGQEYVDAVLHAFFQNDQNIGRADVLEAIAADIGVSPNDFARDLNQGRCRREHVEALHAALTVGVSVVPTFMVGIRRVEGVPSAAVLRQTIQAALADENSSRR